MSDDDSPTVSRRTLLAASGGVLAASGVGTAGARGGDGERATNDDRVRPAPHCPEATLEPNMEHCEGAAVEGCADDHPGTRTLRTAVEAELDARYPTVGALIDDGFRPYFDAFDTDEDGWSHWLSPEFIGDDAVLDPRRPEAVLVDNDLWRPIGVMFVATRDGDPAAPPTIYEADDGRCAPWHSHVGFPGRFAWWYYRQVYEGDYGRADLALPCRTPCMLHVWTVPHPEGAHAHDGPPPEYRDGREPAEPGFDTDAEPGTDELDWDVLPDEVVPRVKPSDLRGLWER